VQCSECNQVFNDRTNVEYIEHTEMCQQCFNDEYSAIIEVIISPSVEADERV
jgi:hypothetical protein